MAGLPPLLPTPPAAMARLPPLLPTPPSSLKLQDTDVVESHTPKWNRPLEPPASDSRRREPNSPLPSKVRRQSRSPSPYKFGRRSRSPPYKVRRRSRSPPPSKVRRRSRSPPPSEVRHRSRSPSTSPSKVWRRSRSPPPYKAGRRSRSPLPSKVRRRSRSPSPSEVRRRSSSPSPYKVRRPSRSPSPSKVRRRSRSSSPSKGRRRSRSPPPYKVGRRSRSRSPSPYKVRRRLRSPSKVWRRSRSPLPSKVWRRSRSPFSSKVKHRSRSPPYVSVTQRAKQPSTEVAVQGERWRPSSLDESLVENRPSHSHCSCKAPSRNARRKKMKRQKMAEAKKEDPSRNGRRKKMTRQIWGEAKKEFREMKKDKLLENIKKLQACVWLLEKDDADMAEIMEFRSLLESTKKQYAENEAQLAKGRSGAPLQLLNRERREKTHVETVAAPVEKVEGDEQNMDSGKVEGRSLKGCEAVSDENELVEEVNRLKSELETVREDRDDQLAQAQSLMADITKQKEVARRYGVELEDAMRRVAALEEGCLLRRETIKALQIQLASANEKLTEGD